MITAGIDAGSRAIKVVLVDHSTQEIIAFNKTDQGINQGILAQNLLEEIMADAKIDKKDLGAVVATGYGRDRIDAATDRITEITCHARGVSFLNPDCRTIIDIGGQDSKVIRLRENGNVRDFSMNDRCAAGTGRFMEVVAQRLDLELNELGKTAALADDPCPISSMCVVFAETEIVGLLASGATQSNIVAGVQKSIATRLASMAGRSVEGPVIFTGGVARITGMKEVIQEALKCPVAISDKPQFTGALGAALLARESA